MPIPPSREVAAENATDLAAAFVLVSRAMALTFDADWVRETFDFALDIADSEETDDAPTVPAVRDAVWRGDWRVFVHPEAVTPSRRMIWPHGIEGEK